MSERGRGEGGGYYGISFLTSISIRTRINDLVSEKERDYNSGVSILTSISIRTRINDVVSEKERDYNYGVSILVLIGTRHFCCPPIHDAYLLV